METKICSKCKIEKSIEEFGKDCTRKDGKKHRCKICEYQVQKKYRESEKGIEAIKRYKNSEKGKETAKKYEQTEKRKEYVKNHKRERYNNDSLYKFTQIMRKTLRKSFKDGGYKKTDIIESTEVAIGCLFKEAKKYIEEKFEPWMSWDNHGKYNGKEKYGWDIDHIIPLSSAKTEEDIIKLFHYTNLQPLDSYINRNIKKDKVEYEINKC